MTLFLSRYANLLNLFCPLCTGGFACECTFLSGVLGEKVPLFFHWGEGSAYKCTFPAFAHLLGNVVPTQPEAAGTWVGTVRDQV